MLVAASATGSAGAQTIAAPCSLSVRTLDELGAGGASRGSVVRAMVLLPCYQASRLVVAPRTVLEGVVEDVGKENSRGVRHFIQPHFTSMLVGDTTRVPISAWVTSVDNARETVDDQGRILGPPLPSLPRARSSWASVILGTLDPIAGAVLLAALRGEGIERHRRVAFAPGTDMTVRLQNDVPLPAWPTYREPDSIAGDPGLPDLIARLPLRGIAAAGRIPMDFVNIVFIGSAGQLQRAFVAAGWDLPARMGTRADFETFVKAAEGKGYAHQPVSKQLMFGRPPDLVFQRVTDTFAKRHHIRIWNTSVEWRGTPVWAATATHDIGLKFSRAQRAFAHRVEADIDGERDKVVSDLVAYLQVDRLSMVPRVPPPDDVTRGPVRSDWRVAVVRLAD